MFVLILTGPFVLLSLLGIATNITITPTSTLIDVADQFPSFVFLAFTLFGLTGIVPYHRFISAHANAYKMIRYLNCYRLYFYQKIKDEADAARWRSAIEKDPRHPVPKIIRNHWTTYFGGAMCVANTLYVALGVWLLENQVSLVAGILSGLGTLVLHYLLRVTNDCGSR